MQQASTSGLERRLWGQGYMYSWPKQEAVVWEHFVLENLSTAPVTCAEESGDASESVE